jgi:hypothetical protein
MESMAVQERRFKMLLIHEERILSWMRLCMEDYPIAVVLQRFRSLPPNCELLRVDYLFEQRGFGFLLAHASFDQVDLGAVIPMFVADSTEHVLEIKQGRELLIASQNAVVSLSIMCLPRLDENVATDRQILDIAIAGLRAAIAKAEA